MRARKLTMSVGLMTLTLPALTTIDAWAEVSTEKAQKLVEQCQEKTLQHRDGKKLTGNPVKGESNAKDYKPGEPFELHINFTGHGNTVHNVTCEVDGQGQVSFKEIDQSGSAHK